MLHLTDFCCALFVVLSTQQHNIEDGLIQEFVSPSDEQATTLMELCTCRMSYVILDYHGIGNRNGKFEEEE